MIIDFVTDNDDSNVKQFLQCKKSTIVIDQYKVDPNIEANNNEL